MSTKEQAPTIFGEPMTGTERGTWFIDVSGVFCRISRHYKDKYNAVVTEVWSGPPRETPGEAARDIEVRLLAIRDAISSAADRVAQVKKESTP